MKGKLLSKEKEKTVSEHQTPNWKSIWKAALLKQEPTCQNEKMISKKALQIITQHQASNKL